MDWTEFGTAVGTQAAPIIATLLLAVISALATVAVKRIKEWTGVQVTAEQRAMFDALTTDGIHFAEEQALKALKANDPTPDSDTKMELAVKHVVDRAKAMGLPEMADEQLRQLIEANNLSAVCEHNR